MYNDSKSEDKGCDVWEAGGPGSRERKPRPDKLRKAWKVFQRFLWTVGLGASHLSQVGPRVLSTLQMSQKWVISLIYMQGN